MTQPSIQPSSRSARESARAEGQGVEPDEFRAALARASDFAARYLEDVGELPVLAQVRPGEIREQLPRSAPENGQPLDHILDDFERLVLPGITHWNHPRFFAYFGSSGSEPGIVAELLIATVNVNAMLWRSSPAATELEEVATDWLRDAMGLPSTMRGVINDTASSSTLYALVAARESLSGSDARRHGVDGRRLRAYASTEAHSSVDKAAITLGIGLEGLVKVPVDGQFRMDAKALADAIRRDRDAGLTPFAVVATVGTTSTTSIDPVEEIARICGNEGLWLHVDAAYGGAAAVSPRHRHVLAGSERADSLVVNPHKWLFVPLDCSVLYCGREEVLKRAFSLVPDYLTTSDGDEARNLMDFGNSLGRRFRGLKLWFVLRAFGLDGIRGLIEAQLAMARQLESWVQADPEFELLAPVPFSTVVFSHRGGDRRTEEIVEAANRSGEVFISHTRVNGRFAIRVAIGNLRTTMDDVRIAWEVIRSEALRATGTG